MKINRPDPLDGGVGVGYLIDVAAKKIPAVDLNTMPRKTVVAHGVTSSGAQRAKDIAAVIAREKAARIAAGAKVVEIVFGHEQGTLMVFEW